MEQEIDLRAIWGLLRRQIWLILTVVLVIMVVVAGVLFTLTPQYTATTKILVDLTTKDLLEPDANGNISASDANARVESEVAILNSDNAYLEVIQKENLVADDEFGVRPDRFESIRQYLNLPSGAAPSGMQLLGSTLNRLKKASLVSREGLTYIIEVVFTSKDPKKAARLANSLADTYIQQQLRSKVSRTLSAKNIIESQLAQANTDLVTSEKAFDNYLNENLDRIEKETSSAQLSQLRTELERIRQQKEESEGRVKVVELGINAGDYTALADSFVSQLDQRKKQISAALAQSAEGSERAVNLRAELSKIDGQLKDQTSQGLDKLRKEVSGYGERETAVREELRSAMLQSNLPLEITTEIYSLQQSSTIARNQYQSLLQRLRELETKAQLQIADSRIVNEAVEPTAASFPNKPLILTAALVFAIGLAGGLAVIRELFIGGFTSEAQVEQLLGLSLATTVGRQTASNHSVKYGVADLVTNAPLSIFSESIRRLRVLIERRKQEKPGEEAEGIVIMVTSSVPNEGKSTTALALARTFARSGKKTLIMDCDLRKPSLHKLAGLEPTSWFTDLLRGRELPPSVTKQAVPDPLSDLSMIFGTRVTDMATDDLLMGDRFEQILKFAKRHYDYVVIDTPPVGAVVDALYLARHVDFIVFVLKWASTPQNLARRMIASLREQKGHETEIVAVLNQKQQTKIDGYGGYGGYSAYYGQPEDGEQS